MSDLLISGYASRFGEADLSGDIVQRGAFAASLLERNEPFPMLFGHQTDTPIGVWDRILEDACGLFVEGRILGPTSIAGRLVEAGAVSGLSIGYRARRFHTRAAGGRLLTDIDLWEVSVVAFPMLRSARITQIGEPLQPLANPQRRHA